MLERPVADARKEEKVIRIKQGKIPYFFNLVKVTKGNKTYAVIEINQSWLKSFNYKNKKKHKLEYKHKRLEDDLEFQKKVVSKFQELTRDEGIINPDNVFLINKFDGIFGEDKEKYSANDLFELFEKASQNQNMPVSKYSLGNLSQNFKGLLYNKPYKAETREITEQDLNHPGKTVTKKVLNIMFEPYFNTNFQKNPEYRKKIKKYLLNLQRKNQDVVNPLNFNFVVARNYQNFYFADFADEYSQPKPSISRKLMGIISDNQQRISDEIEKCGPEQPYIKKLTTNYNITKIIDSFLEDSKQLYEFACVKKSSSPRANGSIDIKATAKKDFVEFYNKDLKEEEGEKVLELYKYLVGKRQQFQRFFKRGGVDIFFVNGNGTATQLVGDPLNKVNNCMALYNVVFEALKNVIKQQRKTRKFLWIGGNDVDKYEDFLNEHKDIKKDIDDYDKKKFIYLEQISNNNTFDFPNLSPQQVNNNQSDISNKEISFVMQPN